MIKYLKALGYNLLLFIGLYFVIAIGYNLLGNINSALGIIFVIITLVIFAMISHKVHKGVLRFKKPMIATLTVSASAMFLYITLVGNLLIALGLSGGSYSFSIDTYPPESKAHNGDWTHKISIITDSKKAIWEEDDLKYLTIMVVDSSKEILFQKRSRMVIDHFIREVVWDSFADIKLSIQDAPLDRVESNGVYDLVYGDTTDVLEMTLTYNDTENRFEVDTLSLNETLVRN